MGGSGAGPGAGPPLHPSSPPPVDDDSGAVLSAKGTPQRLSSVLTAGRHSHHVSLSLSINITDLKTDLEILYSRQKFTFQSFVTIMYSIWVLLINGITTNVLFVLPTSGIKLWL